MKSLLFMLKSCVVLLRSPRTLKKTKTSNIGRKLPVGPEDAQTTTRSDYLMTADGFVSKELQAA